MPPGGAGGIGGMGGPGGGNPSGDRRVVWVLRDRPTPVGIRIGASDGSMTEIVQVMRGQLDEGDRVITEMTGGAESSPPAMGRMPGGMRGL